MKALVTMENGNMFHVDTHARLLVLMDKLGKPVATRSLQRDPIVVPGLPCTFSCGDGLEITEGKVVQVIYCR